MICATRLACVTPGAGLRRSAAVPSSTRSRPARARRKTCSGKLAAVSASTRTQA